MPIDEQIHRSLHFYEEIPPLKSSDQLQKPKKKYISGSFMQQRVGQDTFLQQLLFYKYKKEKNPYFKLVHTIYPLSKMACI